MSWKPEGATLVEEEWKPKGATLTTPAQSATQKADKQTAGKTTPIMDSIKSVDEDEERKFIFDNIDSFTLEELRDAGLSIGEQEEIAQKRADAMPGRRTAGQPQPVGPVRTGIRAWEPSLLDKIKMRLQRPTPAGGVDRSDRPFTTLGQLGLHHTAETLSGLGLHLPDVISGELAGGKTLAEAVDKWTGFEPSPRDIRAGKAGQFVGGLHTAGAIVGPVVGTIPARLALQRILASGLTFGTRRAAEELADKVRKDEPFSWEGIHFESGIGALFGAGEVGLGKAINFVKGLKKLPKPKITNARAEVNAALKNYKKTGDRTAWDAVRTKYAGITTEGAARIKARAKAPDIKEFGKYPITTVKAQPTRGVQGPETTLAAKTGVKGGVVPKGAIKRIPEVPQKKSIEKLQAEIDSYMKENKDPPTELLAEFNAATRKQKKPPIDAAKFAKEERLDKIKTKAEMGDIATEGGYQSQSTAFNKHIDYFEGRQLPKTSQIPRIQKNMRVVNGKRLAGTITAQEANIKIQQLRKMLFETAKREGVALRKTIPRPGSRKEGKTRLSVRKAGTYVPEEFAQYGKFKDVYPLGKDVTRSIQEIDGSLSRSEKVKTKGQAGALEQNVLWPTRDMSIQKLKYIKEKGAEIKGILSGIKRDSAEDRRINLVLEAIGSDYRDISIKELLGRKDLRAIAGAKTIKQAVELRRFYDDLIEEQNIAREMRNQQPIPYTRKYSPHILRDTTIWEQLMFRRLPTEKVHEHIFGKKAPLPDYIRPNKQFNPRAEARWGNMPYEERVKSAMGLAERYLVTASKDIFNTSIIQNNKAFIQQLESMEKKDAANYLSDWTAEAYAGIAPALDRGIKLTQLPKAQKAMRWFNQVRNMAVFPLNLAWNLTTQPSSMAFTIARQGGVNTLKGFKQWISDPKIRGEMSEDYYSYIVKASQQGRITKQDAQNLIGENVRVYRTPKEFIQDVGGFITHQIEKMLTGTSIRAAYLTGKKKGLTGQALINYASDEGGKAQSMYNDEDKPAFLRSLAVKTAAPYQTFNYEVVNAFKEWAGRTGTPPDTQVERMIFMGRFLAASTVFALLAKNLANKDIWSWKRPPIPFAEYWLTPIMRIFNNEYIGASGSGLTSPVETAQRLAKGIDDFLETGATRKLRNEVLKYGPGILGIPGGVQISRTVDAIIAYSQGGVKDRRGRMMFKMEDPQDLAQAIFSGVWSTKGGRGYLDPEYSWKRMSHAELQAEISKRTYKSRYKRKDGNWYPAGHPHSGKEEVVAWMREILKGKEKKNNGTEPKRKQRLEREKRMLR